MREMGKGWLARRECCPECGVDYLRGRPDWDTCLACTLPSPAAGFEAGTLLDWAVFAQLKSARWCPYPEHSDSDWVNDSGRLVCGVCHPPTG
jgi:hypothetical protein